MADDEGPSSPDRSGCSATDRARLDAALRDGAGLYRALFDSLDEGLVVLEVFLDAAGRAFDMLYLDANPAAIRILGQDRRGLRLRQVSPDYEQHWYDVFGGVARTGVSVRGEKLVEGGARWYGFYCFRLGAPEQRRIAITFQDVTERRRIDHELRASEARMSRLAARQTFLLRLSDALRPLGDATAIQAAAMRVLGEHLGIARAQYYEADASGQYVESSGGYAEGTPQAVGRFRLDDFGHYLLEDYQAGRTIVVTDVRTDARVGEVERLAYEPLRFRSFVGVPLVKSGRFVATLVVNHDQPRSWSEDDVALIEEVAERTWAAVERARAEEKVLEADRRKTEFLAVLSHELRTPLAPIRSSVHVLERAVPGSEPFARARQVLERQTDHLTRLVDDLLDVVRINSGKIELRRQQVDLSDLVHQAMDDARPSFAEAGIALRLEHALGPTGIDADPTRIAQVIGNLLHNALKFTPAGGSVTVSLATEAGRVRLRVRDSGAGMEPGREEEMFTAFAQGDQGLARSQGGLGLGLSLVKRFVEMHGGEVSACSEGRGRGTEVVVQLPLADATAPRPAPGRAGQGAGRRILVIEDNADAAQSLADALELDGHRVSIARSGGEGVELAGELRPDVILCDVGLPDIDGYQVARRVRAIPSLERVRLVALSGYAQPEDRERARQAGFDVHLAKPADPAVLARVLK